MGFTAIGGMTRAKRPAPDGREYTLVEVDELGVVRAVFLGVDRGWRVTWAVDDTAIRIAEGSRYDLFDALVDWGFSGTSAGEIVRELYGG